MRFLLENTKLTYVDKEYAGEHVGGYGVRIPLAVSSLWSDVQEYKEYYLFEILEDISNRYRGWKSSTKNQQDYFVYFGYHISDVPMSWDEAQTHNLAKTLGVPCNTRIYHSYSDLTGYLWTSINIKDEQGHDVYKEIQHRIQENDGDSYICMRFEIIKK
jgi:hypothetical protein